MKDESKKIYFINIKIFDKILLEVYIIVKGCVKL